MAGSFAAWCESAKVSERCAAVAALADEVAAQDAGPAHLADCERALRHLAADPSPKVRAALASALASIPHAGPALIRMLCDDVDSVAVPLVRSTQALDEHALIDLAATGSVRVRCALASRSRVSTRLSAALASVGEAVVVLELLGNGGAKLTAGSLWAIAERFADDGLVRERLSRRVDLPADLRQRLVLEAGRSLMHMDLVRATLGAEPAARICAEACEGGTVTVADHLDSDAMLDFVRHLRRTDQVTTAFLLRSVCSGRVDLFAAALSSLSGLSFARVRSVLVDAREPSFSALCFSAGLPGEVTALLLAATQSWKAVARSGRGEGHDTTAGVLSTLLATLRQAPQTPATHVLEQTLARLASQARRSTANQTDMRRPLAA